MLLLQPWDPKPQPFPGRQDLATKAKQMFSECRVKLSSPQGKRKEIKLYRLVYKLCTPSKRMYCLCFVWKTQHPPGQRASSWDPVSEQVWWDKVLEWKAVPTLLSGTGHWPYVRSTVEVST